MWQLLSPGNTKVQRKQGREAVYRTVKKKLKSGDLMVGLESVIAVSDHEEGETS